MIEVRRLTPARRADFFRLHAGPNGWGECYCVAWWLSSWDDWADRTAEQNRTFREELFARDEDDGYLAYDGEDPVGWCQVGPRDRLGKLASQYALEPDPLTWAVSCFFIAEHARGTGVARRLLAHVIADLGERGVSRLEAFPSRGEDLDPGEAWTGPERLFRAAGFAETRGGDRPVYVLELA